MEDKIREYVENAFAKVKPSKKVEELKDELIINLTEKYQDEVNSGKTPQEAYGRVIAGVGDISEIIDSIKEPSPLQNPSREDAKRSAMLVSIAVMLYIISPFTVPVFIVTFNQPVLGCFVMFLFIAVATGMLIYNQMTKVKYVRADETMVEEFKEWRSKNQYKNSAYRSFKSGYWGIVVVIYFAVNFIFGIWGYSWLIFILAVAIERIVKAVIEFKENEDEQESYHN